MKQITDGVFYTGVLNPSLRIFDIIMSTDYGTTYNSYLVKGTEKTAAIEAAHKSFTDYYLDNLTEALEGRELDYLILNHCEPDHTGCIAKLVEKFPNLTVVVSQAGSIYIKQIANRELKIQTVKDGETLDLGGKTLKFLSAPFLHWPDSIFTWLEEDGVLFSCDFFGSHFCEPQIFDVNTVYDDKYLEALEYYYNAIFGPFKPYVLKGLEKIKDLDIRTCCNSHGPILTKEGKLPQVMELYAKWSAPVSRSSKHIPVFYVSAYGNTRNLANAIAEGIRQALPDAVVDCYDVIHHDMAALAGLMNESDAFLVGSPTLNRDAVAPIWQLLAGIEAVNIQKRPVALFGSFGWSGEAVANLTQRLSGVKAKVFEESFRVNFVPSQEDLQNAKAFGERFAQSLS